MYGPNPASDPLAANNARSRITQALMNIQNPPPRSQTPGAMPGVPTGTRPSVMSPQSGYGAPSAPGMPGVTGGGMPGALPGGAPGSVPPMSMQSLSAMPGGPQFAPPQQPGQMAQQPPAPGQPLY